jgi:hypothetical protein
VRRIGSGGGGGIVGLTLLGIVAAAEAAVPPRAKVPTLVREQAAKIRGALGRSGDARLSAEQARAISGGFVSARRDGRLDVLLHAVGTVGDAQADALARLGVKVLGNSADWKSVPGVALPRPGIVRAAVPYDRIDAVAALPWVAVMRPTIRPATDAIVSEGVQLHRADVAQAAGLTGAGQKVGAISGDVDSIADSIARGELPADVQVLENAGYDDDEGTAMLEIVHDLAPNAKLAFNSTGDTLMDYVDAFHNLVAAGATLITKDIALDDEPAFQQGIGATTAESVARDGVWVSSSAGNLGARHAPRVAAVGTGRRPDDATGPFTECPSPNAAAPAPDNTVNLRGTDNTYNLNLLAGAAVGVTLQWSEPRAIYPTPGQGGFTDLNLYLMDATGTTCLAVSHAEQGNGVGDTIEQLFYANATGAAQAVRVVVDVAGTSSAVRPPLLDLRWGAFSAGVQTVDPPDRAGSLNPDSNYLGFATSAGAVNASVSTDLATVPLESYSAAGPVQILTTTRCSGGKPGPCIGRGGPAAKTFGAPNWAAADGVSVSGVGGFGSGTCPAVVQGDCRFFGTSAAAPTAAGVATLVREARGGDVDPTALNSALTKLAFTRSGSGFGAGVLRAVR